MPESDRLGESIEWIDLEFVERERTPEFAIQESIHLHLAGLSLSNAKQHLDRLGVERSRTAIHNWAQKADLQPDSDADPNQIVVDETVIRVNGQRHWLYATVDPDEPVPSYGAVTDANDATYRAVLATTPRETAGR